MRDDEDKPRFRRLLIMGGRRDTTAPTITSASSGSVNENVTLAFSLTANESVTWSIVGGADQAKFELSGSTLRWASNGTKDFEAPDDANTNNTYVVDVRATDGASNTTDQTITITVLDVAEAAGLALDGSAINTMTGSNTGTVTLTTTLTHDIIVLAVMSENNGGTARHIISVSDVAGLTWAVRKTLGGNVGTTLDLWWAHAPAALSADVITYTLDAAIDDAAVVAFAVNGSSDTAAPWDTNGSLPASATSAGDSTTATVSGISTTATNTMLIGIAGDGRTSGSHTYSPDTGFTDINGVYNGGGSRAAAIGSQYKVVGSTQSSITINSTISTGVPWLMIADAIR